MSELKQNKAALSRGLSNARRQRLQQQQVNQQLQLQRQQILQLRQQRQKQLQQQRLQQQQRRRQRMQVFVMLLIIMGFGLAVGKAITDYKPIRTTARLSDDLGLTSGAVNLSAATQLCQAQTKLRYRDKLWSSYVDSHSTRFDELRDMFLVFLVVTINEKRKQREYGVHCRVLPEQDSVDYYKAIALR